MLQNYQLLREILNPKFTESQQHFQCRQWLEALSRYELQSRQPLDDNLKIATLVNGLRGNLQQHLLLLVKPTSTWQNVREIVENYYSSTFVPNATTGHIAYLAHGSPEDQVNYVKGRRKGKSKGKGGKGKKGGDHYQERVKEKENQETTKEKVKDTTKEEKDTTKDGIHGVKEDTAAITTTKCVVYLEWWTSAQGSQGWRASSTDVCNNAIDAIDAVSLLHFDP